LTLSIVIPTYRREAILVETLRSLLALPERADEILVVDQTPAHEEATEQTLAEWEKESAIRHVRLARPSIPAAMNEGLRRSTGDIVLFLDDDIVPGEALIRGHLEAHLATGAEIVAGQVLQPGEEAMALESDEAFRFCQSLPRWVDEFMGGNFSIRRENALRTGGFDENFVGGGYRFERDFARRVLTAGGRIYFEPGASIRHLRAPHGGTRSYGDHLRSVSPAHSVGEYYDFLKWSSPRDLVRRIPGRLFRAIRTRHHARRPWWIPVTLAAEIGGLAWAAALRLRGPKDLASRGTGS
jgi:GT2 family glycosyltransferase